MEIKVKFTHKKATFKKAHDSDTGYDLQATGYKLTGDRTALLNLGVEVEPPEGYYFELVARSSISKTPFIQHNGVGIIDADYRGELMMPVLCIRNDIDIVSAIEQYFMSGKACAQLVLRKREDAHVKVVEELTDTDRGVGGFGSSDG